MVSDTLRRATAAPNNLLTPRAHRRLVNLFFAYLAGATLLYGLLTAKFYRSWTIADWLINYEGGFVRRGLVGEVALRAGTLLHISPVTVVVATYLTAYAVILLIGRDLALRTGSSWWCLALVLSPATFSFQILDLTGGSRKEVLYFASLALLVLFLRKQRLSPALTSAYLTLAVGVEVLSHEPLVCYCPYFFAALLLSGRKPREAARECAVPFLMAAIAGYASARHLGNRETAIGICHSLGYTLRSQGKDICSGGAIGFLTMTPGLARQRTWTRAWGDLYLIVYPLGTLLALVPLVYGSLSLAGKGFREEIRALWKTAAVSFTASLPLFVYAEDWGRWIYIHIFSLALLLLALQARAQSKPRMQLTLQETQLFPERRRLAAWCLVAYATLWSLPHVPSRTLPFGYLGLAHYISLYL